MYGRNDQQQSQQWTVHAEFTIKHDGLDDTSPTTHTERDENGVKMVYTWTSHPQPLQDNQSLRTDRSTSSSVPDVRDPELPYGFQKGNLVFTSTPPKNKIENSSGYSSELLSPTSGSLQLRPPQPYNRRCRSTCSIVLSTDVTEPNADLNQDVQCGRTHSLRCQTPTAKTERRESFFGCGDPWCYHACSDERFPPLQECDECSSGSKRPSRASTFNVRQRSKSSPPKCDASVQTYEMIDKCTSPFPGNESSRKSSVDSTDSRLRRSKNVGKKAAYNGRRKTEPIFQRIHSPSSFTPDSLDSQQSVKRQVKAPGKLGHLANVKSSTPDSKAGEKKPRTVHIDVYCTGTELESSSSCSDSENKTTSSPQTVFESEKFRLTHKRANTVELPYHLKKCESTSFGNVNALVKKFEKDVSDDESTAYPSQRSSYSHIKDFGSSFSSVPPSWSTMSMSSYALPDDESVANTSWKDTYSDMGSLLESRSSIAQTESLDFVPRRLLQRDSIEEIPEDTASKGSIQPSDSFEYADSEDRFRIKQMERMWCGHEKPWKSPQIQRRHLVQQKRIKEYIDKKMKEAKDSESEDTDDETTGWSIIKDNKKEDQDPKKIAEVVKKCAEQKVLNNVKPNTEVTITPSRTPSIMAIKQRLSLDPSLSSPFTLLPGVFTEQRTVARRFGAIVDVFKKPGHHIGPAKNPDCTCEHCRMHFQMFGIRGRARSWGDSNVTMNWKQMGRNSMPPDDKSPSSPMEENKIEYTDF